MLDQFAFIGIYVIVALVIGITPPALAFFLCPKEAPPREMEVYE